MTVDPASPRPLGANSVLSFNLGWRRMRSYVFVNPVQLELTEESMKLFHSQ